MTGAGGGGRGLTAVELGELVISFSSSSSSSSSSSISGLIFEDEACPGLNSMALGLVLDGVASAISVSKRSLITSACGSLASFGNTYEAGQNRALLGAGTELPF